jgi:hypothetical protein
MSDSVPSFKEAFAKVLELAELTYDGHILTKRDTWKEADMEYLEAMLHKNIEEYHSAFADRAILGEALDVVNFAIMIAARRLEILKNVPRWEARMKGSRE